MLASMLMLGVQLCLPLTMQASALADRSVDVIGLGVKDPTDKSGPDVQLDLPAGPLVALRPPVRVVAPGGGRPCDRDAAVPPLLPVSGYHPSAP